MPKERRARGRNARAPVNVFLNVPYDKKFRKLYLAYIAGISAFGLVPRATVEIPGGQRRLDRILSLIKQCRYSIHDLSRVELDRKKPRTPRFNMPFELGLTVAWHLARAKKHTWFVCEARKHRLTKSLSDLGGTDPYIHGNNVKGVFRELSNAFVRPGRQPTMRELDRIYDDINRSVPLLLKNAGSESVFEARIFKDICFVASRSKDEHVA
jgi:hypothetical protein